MFYDHLQASPVSILFGKKKNHQTKKAFQLEITVHINMLILFYIFIVTSSDSTLALINAWVWHNLNKKAANIIPCWKICTNANLEISLLPLLWNCTSSCNSSILFPLFYTWLCWKGKTSFLVSEWGKGRQLNVHITWTLTWAH